MRSKVKASIRLKKANLHKRHKAVDAAAVARAVRWVQYAGCEDVSYVVTSFHPLDDICCRQLVLAR